MVEVPPDQIWMVVVGFIIAFILAFGIGANDVANSFGTSVGAKVLTLRQACILASIFETLGSILLGAKVSDTIRKGIISIEPYQNDTSMLMIGNVAALSGSCCWLMAATLLRLPVSATHSIVGATVGFALVAHGAKGINWAKLGMIIGSWFISPITAGLVSVLLFYFLKFFILNKPDPLEPGLRWLPVFYAFTIIINLFSVFYDGPEMLGFDKIPIWGTVILSFGSGIIVAILVRCVVVPWQRRRIKEACKYQAPTILKADDDQQDFIFKPGQTISVNSSMNNSQNNSKDNSQDNSQENSRKNSMDLGEKVPLDTVSEMVATEKVLNEKNEKNAATNFLAPPAAVPFSTTGKILAEITHPHESKHADPKTPVPKPPRGKVNKAEDAPLMDNEYKLGTNTPGSGTPGGGSGTVTPVNVKHLTVEDLNKTSKQLLKNQTGFESPEQKKMLALESAENSPGGAEGDADTQTDLDRGRSMVKDRPEQVHLFSFLQILTAIFGGFAHGGNDVSNAIGPLVSLWLIGTTGIVAGKAATPIWILFYGGAGISIGLWIWGRRVIKTIGEDLTKITPSSGFVIEIGSALTVLIASNIGIPISTTHCKVGAVVIVGRFRARENVDWSIFRNIILAWLVTLPISGGISAAIMAGLMQLL